MGLSHRRSYVELFRHIDSISRTWCRILAPARSTGVPNGDSCAGGELGAELLEYIETVYERKGDSYPQEHG